LSLASTSGTPPDAEAETVLYSCLLINASKYAKIFYLIWMMGPDLALLITSLLNSANSNMNRITLKELN
jgi:hypothetical protein